MHSNDMFAYIMSQNSYQDAVRAVVKCIKDFSPVVSGENITIQKHPEHYVISSTASGGGGTSAVLAETTPLTAIKPMVDEENKLIVTVTEGSYEVGVYDGTVERTDVELEEYTLNTRLKLFFYIDIRDGEDVGFKYEKDFDEELLFEGELTETPFVFVKKICEIEVSEDEGGQRIISKFIQYNNSNISENLYV